MFIELEKLVFNTESISEYYIGDCCEHIRFCVDGHNYCVRVGDKESHWKGSRYYFYVSLDKYDRLKEILETNCKSEVLK